MGWFCGNFLMVGWLGFDGFLVWLVSEDNGRTEPVRVQ